MISHGSLSAIHLGHRHPNHVASEVSMARVPANVTSVCYFVTFPVLCKHFLMTCYDCRQLALQLVQFPWNPADLGLPLHGESEEFPFLSNIPLKLRIAWLVGGWTLAGVATLSKGWKIWGSKAGGDKVFRTVQTGRELIQPHAQWVQGVSWG